jgi:hypothetical protein
MNNNDDQIPSWATPDHYKRENNSDLIQDWIMRKSPEEVRAALCFNIEKYLERYGKKDDLVKESEKIMNYAVRLWQYERGLMK